MAKRVTTEDQLAMLRKLRGEAMSAASVVGLRGMLTFPRVHGMVVRGAAELAGFDVWEAKTWHLRKTVASPGKKESWVWM